jgi:hypothetical protein
MHLKESRLNGEVERDRDREKEYVYVSSVVRDVGEWKGGARRITNSY